MTGKCYGDSFRYLWKNADRFSNCFYTYAPNGQRSQISVFHCGFPCENQEYDFSGVKIGIGTANISGTLKFFASGKEYEQWKKYNPILHSELSVAVVREESDSAGTYAYKGTDTVILADIPETLVQKYFYLTSAKGDLCREYFRKLSDLGKANTIDRLFAERFGQKCDHVEKVFETTSGESNDALFYLLFDTFCIGTNNRVHMNTLSKKISYSSLLHSMNSLKETEALLFGVSGLLEVAGSGDFYLYELRNIFDNLKASLKLTSMNGALWKRRTAGPAQSIYLVMGHLAAICYHAKTLRYDISQQKDLAGLKSLLRHEVSEYWKTNYQFGVPFEGTCPKELSNQKIELILINGILPFLFVQQRKLQTDISSFIEDMFRKIAPEENMYTKAWSAAGIAPQNALEAQAIVGLSKNYCDAERCLECPIGTRIIGEIKAV